MEDLVAEVEPDVADSVPVLVGPPNRTGLSVHHEMHGDAAVDFSPEEEDGG
ncbi:hypothetical protein [Streptomyces sp. NPDC017890]|uniref:hypothetical protein n=1 Tax=Streptomyces sp. NPDC017890 TaxID=3365015 RepID=UPI0037B3005F